MRNTKEPGCLTAAEPGGLRGGLKMQELVAATGVPKSTILHYLKEGLLPKPYKTCWNMAYYLPACVERITFIKMLQGKYRLSLAMIKKFL